MNIPDLLDRVIDEAAQRLTEGDTDAAFTARVLARLDEQPGRLAPQGALRPAPRLARRWAPRWAWLRSAAVLSPIAAAVALVIFVVIATRSHPARETVAPETASQAPSAPAIAQVDISRIPPVEKNSGVARTRQVRRAPVSEAPVSEAPVSEATDAGHPETYFPEPSDVDALAPPLLTSPPLTIESIRLTAIPSTDSIAVSGLEPLEPIAVAPIEVIDGR